jgi:outer membrane protein insertion porin family
MEARRAHRGEPPFFTNLTSEPHLPFRFPARGQEQSAAPGSATGVVDVSRDLPAALAYKGRRVEQVSVLGNTQVSTAVILNLVRTKEGDPFDPATVVEDYQRIYRLNKFSNVEPRLEPTAGGVIVTFVVTEQKQIRGVRFNGNVNVSTPDLETAAALRPGESIDPFRINLAKTEIEKLYHDRNYSFAHVSVDLDGLSRTGEVNFTIVEGPMVRIRKIGFIGNDSFSVRGGSRTRSNRLLHLHLPPRHIRPGAG